MSCHAVDWVGFGRVTGLDLDSPEAALAAYRTLGGGAPDTLFPFLDSGTYFAQLETPPTASAFEHYADRGAAAGLRPVPLYDPAFVAAQCPDGAPEDIVAFLSEPRFRAVDPHPLFSKAYALAMNPDVASAGFDPFFHFLHFGWRERRPVHPFVDRAFLLRAAPEGCDRAEFHRLLGAALQRPSAVAATPLFDAGHYRRQAGELSGVDPMLHYAATGWRRGLSPHPLFDPAHYRASTGARPGDPYAEYLAAGLNAAAPSPVFDVEWYRRAAALPDDYPTTPLEHFIRIGAAAGVRPRQASIVAGAVPSHHSGFTAGPGFTAASGRRYAVCTPNWPERFEAELRDARRIEPSIPASYRARAVLHPFCGPLTPTERSAVSVARAIARCRTVLVGATLPDPAMEAGLLAARLGLVTAERPWLTIVSMQEPCVCHRKADGTMRDGRALRLPADHGQAAGLVASALIAGLPDQVVIRTDPLGVALLRMAGRQIEAAVTRVCLLVDTARMVSPDRQFVTEFIATRHSDLHLLIPAQPVDSALLSDAGIGAGRTTMLAAP